jgi:mRNA interferase RelE/StbE
LAGRAAALETRVRYRIQILPAAIRQIDRLPAEERRRVRDAIDSLAADPRPPGSDTLSGVSPHVWRVRVGDCRVLYQVFDGRLVVLVVRVADRREAYSRSQMRRLRRLLDRS